MDDTGSGIDGKPSMKRGAAKLAEGATSVHSTDFRVKIFQIDPIQPLFAWGADAPLVQRVAFCAPSASQSCLGG
jgi:hypothetical protein